MVLNPFRCKQCWVSSVLDRKCIASKNTNKQKWTLFSEGSWYPHGESQLCVPSIQRYLSVCLWTHLWVFLFINWRWQYTYTVRQVYIRQVLVQCFLFWLPFGDAAGQAYMREKKRSVVLAIVLVVNKLFLRFDPTSGGDWAVPAHRTVSGVLTKGSLMDEKHLPKSKFTTNVLNPDHAVICPSPEYWPVPAPSLLHAERLGWKVQLQKNL